MGRLVIKNYFYSTVTGKKQKKKCERCFLQYVGETATALNLRMNTHRTSKKGCEHLIYHSKECCKNSSFFIQVIEVLDGSGYDEIGDLDLDMLQIRLDREDYWFKTLRTFYPYGFNERKRKYEVYRTIGSLFFPIGRNGQRSQRCRDRRNVKTTNRSGLHFVNFFNDQFTSNLKGSFLNIIKNI